MSYQVSPSRHIITSTLIFVLTACSFNPALSKKEFIQYVNNVFKLQNQMTGEVMMLAETEQQQQYEHLLALEQNMHRDCHPLNEYAERENDGLKTGLMLKQQVKKAVYTCEQAALKVQHLLEDF